MKNSSENILPQNPTEIIENNIELPKTVTMGHFWRSLKEGKWQALSSEEIESLIEKIYFNYQPLTELSEKEEKLLRANLKEWLKCFLNSSEFPQLIEQNVLYFKEAELFNPRNIKKFPSDLRAYASLTCNQKCPIFVLQNDKLYEQIQQFTGKEPLSTSEKMSLFSKPEIWFNGHYIKHGARPFKGQGMRHLCKEKNLFDNIDDSYGFLEQKFKTLVENIRKRTNKTTIRLLDIGGAMGLALKEAQELESNLETYNLTIDEEPVMFPVDHLYLCPAERMPKEFANKIDLIISNAAFVYFTYPDIALKNVTKALHRGGEARIKFSVSTEYSGLSQEELEKRKDSVYQEMRILEDKNIIEIELDKTSFAKYPFYSQIRIKKNQNL